MTETEKSVVVKPLFKNMLLGSDNSISYSDLIGHTRKLTKTDSTKFTAADIKALLNLYYHEFINEILKSGGIIDFNIETETIDLVADAATHSITGKVLRIKKINIQWISGGKWYPVTFFNIGERSSAMDDNTIARDFSKTNPHAHIYLDDEILKVDIFPIPGVSNTTGLKVWKVLEVTELSSAANEPSIPEAYQKYLCYGASRDYFIEKEMFQKVDEMEKRMFVVTQRAIQFYASRSEDENYTLESGYPDDYGD